MRTAADTTRGKPSAHLECIESAVRERIRAPVEHSVRDAVWHAQLERVE